MRAWARSASRQRQEAQDEDENGKNLKQYKPSYVKFKPGFRKKGTPCRVPKFSAATYDFHVEWSALLSSAGLEIVNGLNTLTWSGQVRHELGLYLSGLPNFLSSSPFIRKEVATFEM